MAETFTEWGIQYSRYHDGKLEHQHVAEYGDDETEARKDIQRSQPAYLTATLVRRTVTHTEWEEAS